MKKSKMGYHAYTRWGRCESNPSTERLREILAELDVEDDEHPDVSLSHESEWTLSAYSGGSVVWENLEGGEPRHLRDVNRDRVLDLWLKLSRGEFEAIEQEPWQPGY
jgi:hypothetical protein